MAVSRVYEKVCGASATEPRGNLVCDAVPCQLDLRRFHAQGFQTDDAAFGFRLAENQRQMRPALVGALELRFEAAAAAMGLDTGRRDCIPDALRQRQALGLGALAG